MRNSLGAAALAISMAAGSSQAQTALAPWFDADGFYNRAGIQLERASNDLTACRVEAARLKSVRNTRSRVEPGAAFTSSGQYDPVVAGAAAGIASIMFALQDARYNGSIEQIEFRDCAVALGYRHYRLSESDRARLNNEADHGFAALVAAETPAQGRLNEGETERNYFSAALTQTPYQNATSEIAAERVPPGQSAGETIAAEASLAGNEIASAETTAADETAPTPAAEASPTDAQTQPAPASVIARLGPGEIASPQPGMAIVVISARQLAGSMQIPFAGDTFRFMRVSAEGAFLDLLQPSSSFAVRSHMNSERRRDPTLAGAFAAPRYSTYVIPAGRYVLADAGPINACLGTLSFEVREGDVAWLGDFILRPQNLPVGTLFNPVGNINSGMDHRLREDVRVAIGDDIEAARAALQADEAARQHLTRVSFANGYRIACTGRYIGRINNPDWPVFSQTQAPDFHDAMAAALARAGGE